MTTASLAIAQVPIKHQQLLGLLQIRKYCQSCWIESVTFFKKLTEHCLATWGSLQSIERLLIALQRIMRTVAQGRALGVFTPAKIQGFARRSGKGLR